MSASKMELYSLFWNTAAIAGPSTLRKTLSSGVNRFYCAEDDRHARNYELELHKISLRSVCSLPCTSQYRTNGCMCFRDAAEISPQRSRISCCGPTYQHSVNFAMCSLQSFAALYANVRIWEVVFYKKLVVIPPPDHPRRAVGRGIFRGYNARYVGSLIPSTISRFCASLIPAEYSP